jgi:hypothetical protein
MSRLHRDESSCSQMVLAVMWPVARKSGGPVVARRGSTALLELGDEVPDQVPRLIDALVEATLLAASRLERGYRGVPGRGQRLGEAFSRSNALSAINCRPAFLPLALSCWPLRIEKPTTPGSSAAASRADFSSGAATGAYPAGGPG